MRKVRLAPAESFRRASFVYACLCGVLAAAQAPRMAAPGSRRAHANCLVWVVPRGSDRCEWTEAQQVLGKPRRDETQVAISKTQHGVPDTATELAMAGQCSFFSMLSFLYQLLLSHLNVVQVATETQCQLHAHHHYQLPTSFYDWWCSHHSSFLCCSAPVVSTAGHRFHVAKKALLHSR